MEWQNYIHSDSKVLRGKPIIKNTRISVELILDLMAQGWSRQDILESYPTLSHTHLQAVFAYLRDCIQTELYFPTSQKIA